jgi:hypothetical protein
MRMKYLCNTVALICTLFSPFLSFSQTPAKGDSLLQTYHTIQLPVKKNTKVLGIKQAIVPASMLFYGALSNKSTPLRKLNLEVKEELWMERPHKQLKVDNYLQYAPLATVVSLNVLGVNGLNNPKNQAGILLMSQALMGATVFSVKQLTRQLRPDGSSLTSFPSGHTAEAFASAEFLRSEYEHLSPWYTIAGYTAAAFTGYLRMYNNKHWLGDVAAGAGIGIAATRFSYWLYPKIQKKVFKTKETSTVLLPQYNNGIAGFTLVKRLGNSKRSKIIK